MKNLKVSEAAHQELKVFAAKVSYNMSVLASDAILKYLKDNGHTRPPKKQSSKSKK